MKTSTVEIIALRCFFQTCCFVKIIEIHEFQKLDLAYENWYICEFLWIIGRDYNILRNPKSLWCSYSNENGDFWAAGYDETAIQICLKPKPDQPINMLSPFIDLLIFIY